MASTGAVRAARRAGTSAATRLTSVPVTIETTTVNASSGMSPDISMPMPANTCLRIVTSPRPAPTPRTDPMTPTAAAWPSTEANTWVGEAPTARSIANSRCRCRTTIWNVLLMMNVPTNRAIAAKISRNVEMKPSADCQDSRLSSRIWSPVITSTSDADAVPASAASTSRMSVVWPTPSSAYTVNSSVVRSGEYAATAVSMSRPTMIAPAMLAPNPISPTTSTGRTSPATTTVVASPTTRPDRSSAEVSRTISPGPSGMRPSMIEPDSSSSCRPMPKLGGPELMTAVPSAPTRTIEPETSGTTPATPSTARISSSRSSGSDA